MMKTRLASYIEGYPLKLSFLLGQADCDGSGLILSF